MKTWVTTTQPHVGQTPTETTAGLSLLSAVQTEFGTYALDFWTPLKLVDDTGDPSLLLSDGIHPNATGQQKLFDVVVAANIPAAL